FSLAASPRRYTLFPYPALFRSRVLVAVRSYDVDLPVLTRGLEDPEAGGVGVLEDDVGAASYLGQRLLLAGGHVIPVADVGDQHADRKSTRLNSSHVKISYVVFY